MNSRVGAARDCESEGLPEDGRQRLLDFALNGSQTVLLRPPVEPTPVVPEI